MKHAGMPRDWRQWIPRDSAGVLTRELFDIEVTEMKVGKMRFPSGQEAIGAIQGDLAAPLTLSGGHYETLAEILETDDPAATIELLIDRSADKVPVEDVQPLSVIDAQEVWAAGVTYTRSKTARMAESTAAATHYDRVYTAPRPELFFKATPSRVVASGQPVRIRQDASWNVPEPELALVLNSAPAAGRLHDWQRHELARYRGRKPALPATSQGVRCLLRAGPWIRWPTGCRRARKSASTWSFGAARLRFSREQPTSARWPRSFEDLIGFLGRDNHFRQGVILLTGTGIVPNDDFTLAAGDIVEISIDGIGKLANPVMPG